MVITMFVSKTKQKGFLISYFHELVQPLSINEFLAIHPDFTMLDIADFTGIPYSTLAKWSAGNQAMNKNAMLLLGVANERLNSHP